MTNGGASAGSVNYTGVMSGLYRDEGVVLRTIKLGEADRIITIFTQGHGKVRAVAKGVRKTSSRFGARLEPASHVALLCYKGRELDVVTQVETIESNRAVREGYAMFTHAVPMLEVVDHVTPERDPNAALYRMLTGALRTLGAPLGARHDRVLLEAAEPRRLPADARRLRALRRRRRRSSCSPSISPTAACSASRAPRSRVGRSRPPRSTCCAGSSVAV